VISADDHIVEPRTRSLGAPRKFADRAPKVVDTESGGQTWVYDGQELPNVGSTPWSGDQCRNTVSSRSGSTKCAGWHGYPCTRQGYGRERHLRIAELPSFLPGSPASGCSRSPRIATGAGVSPRMERLHFDVWAGRIRSDHSLPIAVAAGPGARRQMIYENAERGFHAVTFSEIPRCSDSQHPLGPLGSDDGSVRRDRHRGESAHRVSVHPRTPPRTLRQMCKACCLCLRHFRGRRLALFRTAQQVPDLKICLSEGGIVGCRLLDRLDHMLSYHAMYGTWQALARA